MHFFNLLVSKFRDGNHTDISRFLEKLLNVCAFVCFVCVFMCVCMCIWCVCLVVRVWLEGLVVAGERKEVECRGICTRHPECLHRSCCPTADILSRVYECAQRVMRRGRSPVISREVGTWRAG